MSKPRYAPQGRSAAHCGRNAIFDFERTNMKLAAKILLFTIMGLLGFATSLAYGLCTGPVASWIVLWLLSFAMLLFCRGSLQERGLIFLVSSVVIAVGGQKILDSIYGKQFIVELLAQVFIVLGAGIGANLISNWLVTIEQRRK